MRISELSRASGVPVATIKYYLREGLLHEGQLTSATQAQYDEGHVARLRLVRALIGVGGLSVAATREVLDQLDHPADSTHDLLGAAHRSLGPAVDEDVDTSAAESLLDRLGWQVRSADRQAVRQLAAALTALEAADFPLSEDEVVSYAQAMRAIAEREVADVPLESTEAAVRYMVLGTVLVEPLLLALRRLAQVDASARRYGTR
ncbi:MerR family transcriptional regulator [Saccharopolyspora sp. NPDC000359]|uniref:MerR family transcriptional regulator n=1 Tax=Saccharopolyspora sp. NPDC000359 TaxID=3154251 RepID=UPI00333290F7